ISLPDDDPEIFTILLNIVHGQVRQVPPEVSVKIMTGLSILVDKYQWHEIIELYVKLWMPKLKDSFPTEFTPAVPSWISISWVFRLSAEFQHVTKLAQLESCGPLDNGQSLPIPAYIIDQIEDHRQEGITSLLAAITKIINKFNNAEVACRSNFDNAAEKKRYACDAMIVGTLLKSAVKNGLWPLPELPYPDWSIERVANGLRNLELMAMCDETFQHWNRNKPKPAHGWTDWLLDEAKRVEETCEGLVLDEPK
ncbi:hypothetical protein DL98DRAFT_409424, partial [Cadophora sp. DSE1049]